MSSIQWFPGHMTRAKREMESSIKLCDMIIEIRDARIPKSSSNPILKKLINNKPHLIILSKKDKADKNITKKWEEYFKRNGIDCISLDLINDNVIKEVKNKVFEIMKPWFERQKRRGINPRSVRVMVSGIPNVGKSTLINKIAKKKIAKTADKPGVTRSLQWIKLDKDIDLLDTPGILWPKFDDELIGLNLAVVGSINDDILDFEKLGIYALDFIIKNYPEYINKRYGIDAVDDLYENFKKIGEARKIYTKNEVDINKTIIMFINEIRDDKLGEITWDVLNEKDE